MDVAPKIRHIHAQIQRPGGRRTGDDWFSLYLHAFMLYAWRLRSGL